MTDQHADSASQEVERLRRQRATLAGFGRHALRTDDLDELLQEATALVSEAIDVDLVKVLELLPDGDTMLLRAGVNWNPGVVGRATFGAHKRSPGGYALQTDEPVISRDTATEDRFDIPDLLKEHGVKSMVNVVIRGERAPFGVLEVDSRRHLDFDEDDIFFLQTYANLLASAVDRLRTHRELQEAAESRRMLLGELHHRVRNMLANVRALARRTLAGSASIEEFAAAFDNRLRALVRTQDLLLRPPSEPVGIRDILVQELQAHGAEEGERIILRGPNSPLSHEAIQGLAVGFHELATNAVKHGAFSAASGRIEVSWDFDTSECGRGMLIIWRERGVEIRGEPSRKGYGSETIERTVPYILDGTSTLTFHRDGIECRIRFPLPDKHPQPTEI